MFNERSDRLSDAVSSTLEQAVESTILDEKFKAAFAKLMQVLAQKLKDEWDKRARIEIDHENYGLEYDETTDSYVWKKSDELGNLTEEGLNSNQIQKITSKLIDSEVNSYDNFDVVDSECEKIKVTTSLKNSGDTVIYEQIDNKNVITNVVKEIDKENFIEEAWEPLNIILNEEQLSTIADELLSQVEVDMIPSDLVDDLLSQVEFQLNKKSVPNIEGEASELLNQVESQIELEEIASNLLAQIESQLEEPDFIVGNNGEVSNNKPGKIVQKDLSDLVFFEEEENGLILIKTVTKEVSAANVTSQKATSSPEFSDSQKSWVREKQVPIYADTIPRQYAVKKENKEIAIATKQLVRNYGEIQEDGSVTYKSDAFTIKKVGSEYSIHRRNDKLSGYANPVMSFSLDKKGNPIKVNADKLNSAERQEFLLIADNIRDGAALPDKNADIREMANKLSSLAPAGTQKVITSFQNAEIVKIMADLLKASGKDELRIGDFRIKGEQNAEVTKASLQLYKMEADGKERLTVDWELTKQEDGVLETNTKVMKLGENEINQLKFVLNHANYLNNNQYSSTLEAKIATEKEIPLPVNPTLRRDWKEVKSTKFNGKNKRDLEI